MFEERGLHRMQLPILFQSLDRRDFVALMHDGESQTRIHSPSVYVHRAGATLAVIAAFLGPEKVQVLAQGIKQRYSRLQAYPMLLPIYFEHHRHCFRALRSCARRSYRTLLGFCRAQPRGADGGNSSRTPAKERSP